VSDETKPARLGKEEAAYLRGKREAALGLFDMVDVYDHALGSLALVEGSDAIQDGLVSAREQLITLFEKLGFESLFPLGEMFDPNLHEAIGLEQGEGEDGSICRVHRRGWLQDGLVVRAAMVTVLELPAGAAASSVSATPEPAKQVAAALADEPEAPAGDSPSARRRRQRERSGMDSFGFAVQEGQGE
jgi:hypothetical protein